MDKSDPRSGDLSSVDGFRDNLRDFVPDDGGAELTDVYFSPGDEAVFGTPVDSDETIDFGTVDFGSFEASEEPLDEIYDEFKAPAGSSAASAPSATSGAVRGKHASHAAKSKSGAASGSAARKAIIAVVAVIAVAALSVGGYYLFNMRDTAPEQTLTAPVTTQQSSASSTATQEKPALRITVKADGYSESATPIMYRIELKTPGTETAGQSSSGSASGASAGAQTVHYGVVSSASTAKHGSQTVQLEPGTFEVDIDELPAGTYEITWSHSILPDGSILLAPAASTFEIGEKTRALEVALTRLGGDEVPAEQAKDVYGQLLLWLNTMAGDTTATRDDVLKRANVIAELAHRNIDSAASVAEEGGIDHVGVEADEEDEGEEDYEGYEDHSGYSGGGAVAHDYSDYAPAPSYEPEIEYVLPATPDEPYVPVPDDAGNGGDGGSDEGGAGAGEGGAGDEGGSPEPTDAE